MESVASHLHALGHQVSHATDLDVEIPGYQRIEWRTADTSSFELVVFVCGPIMKTHTESRKLFDRFSSSCLIGVGVSLFPHETRCYFNPFQVAKKGVRDNFDATKRGKKGGAISPPPSIEP